MKDSPLKTIPSKTSLWDKVLLALAITANTAQFLLAAVLCFNAYGKDVYVALLLMAVPVITFVAWRFGFDAEEHTLARLVRKARLKKELEELTGK